MNVKKQLSPDNCRELSLIWEEGRRDNTKGEKKNKQ